MSGISIYLQSTYCQSRLHDGCDAQMKHGEHGGCADCVWMAYRRRQR
jgi:hypothetical protein